MTPQRRHKLYDFALQLINTHSFYTSYINKAKTSRCAMERREQIKAGLSRLHVEWTGTLGMDSWDDIEHIRRYVDNYWSEHFEPVQKEAEPNVRTNRVPFIDLDLSVGYAVDSAGHICASLPINQPAASAAQPVITQPQQELTMTAPIAITTKTFVNGVDIATLSDSAIYDLIAKEEAKIKELGAIENKPKRLVEELDKRAAGIAALVAHLDNKAD